jgi:hypothetical protein
MAPETITSSADVPAMIMVRTPIITSGKPAPRAGPAAHGELFSGKEYPQPRQYAARSLTRL